MRDFVKGIRLSLGQVLVILSNALVVFGWGMRIDNTVGNLGEAVVRVEAEVGHVHDQADALDIRTAVLEERTRDIPSPNAGGN